MEEKRNFLKLVESNIKKHSFHITLVNNIVEPRFAYTIGLKDIFDFELIFAGGIFFLKEDVFKIFDVVVNELKKGKGLNGEKINTDFGGEFSLFDVDPSWSHLMALGALDYYKVDSIKTKQIVPDSNHYTLDIPNMYNEWDSSTEPIWKWLKKEWSYDVPEESTVVTNMDSLRGAAITEIMRWENDEWEMFAGAGPDVDKKDVRVVSLGIMLGIDISLSAAISLDVGKGLWRESSDKDWKNWG